MLAVSHGCMNVMRLILDQSDCDVNLQDFDGSTALMCAAEHNNTEIVETLLAHPSIDVLIKDQVYLLDQFYLLDQVLCSL